MLSGFVLAMQVLLSNFDVNQSHIGVVMTEQTHQGWQADAVTQHGGGIDMPELVRNQLPLHAGLGSSKAGSTALPGKERRKVSRSTRERALSSSGTHRSLHGLPWGK